jgi:hypothetical protein
MFYRSVPLFLSVLVVLSLAGTGEAQRDRKGKVPKNYHRTGELLTCVPRAQISETKILDKSTILFYMLGGTAYLNELPEPCGPLGPRRTITYETSLEELCNTDVITVIDAGAAVPTLGSCGLGKFEVLKKSER